MSGVIGTTRFGKSRGRLDALLQSLRRSIKERFRQRPTISRGVLRRGRYRRLILRRPTDHLGALDLKIRFVYIAGTSLQFGRFVRHSRSHIRTCSSHQLNHGTRLHLFHPHKYGTFIYGAMYHVAQIWDYASMSATISSTVGGRANTRKFYC